MFLWLVPKLFLFVCVRFHCCCLCCFAGVCGTSRTSPACTCWRPASCGQISQTPSCSTLTTWTPTWRSATPYAARSAGKRAGGLCGTTWCFSVCACAALCIKKNNFNIIHLNLISDLNLSPSGNLHVCYQHAQLRSDPVYGELSDEPSSQRSVADLWKPSGMINIKGQCVGELRREAWDKTTAAVHLITS